MTELIVTTPMTNTQEPSILTQAMLFERYGPRLNVEQLSEALGWTAAAIHNSISAGKFGIPTYIDGKRRWADFRDVAAYFDRMRAAAHHEATPA